LGEFPWKNALRFFCWGRSLKIHIEIKSELFTDGCICAPKKKRQKKRRSMDVYIYLWFTSIHVWCELCSMVWACSMVWSLSVLAWVLLVGGVLMMPPWLSLSQVAFSQDLAWLALSMSGIKFWGAASPPPFFSNNKMQQKRNT
jgi:hypothetical protein